MSKATRTHTTPDLAPAIEKLRALAAEAVKSGSVTEPEPHPDADLLTLCMTILEGHAEADAIYREALRNFCNDIANSAFAAEMQKRDAAQDRLRSPMARVGKIAAKTAPGVYAKALVLRECGGTASKLAVSVANDLINCPGLRSVLWPVERV